MRKIEFINVNFAYENSNIYINDLNFEFQCGFSYMIRGNNGSGKTTLVDIMSKMLKDYTGYIMFDGKELHTISKQEICNIMGICFQQTPIFRDTLINNIIFDRPKDMEKLHSLDFFGILDEFEDRMNTLINDTSISGGQAQKIGILRTLYLDKEVFVFDEPTANLDIFSCEKFWDNINRIKKDKIIIVISHDLNTDKYVDGVIKL